MAIHLELVNHFNYMDRNGQIFCKRQDKVRKVAPKYKGCDDCPYLFGSLQGMGVECMWARVSARRERRWPGRSPGCNRKSLRRRRSG